MLDDLGWDGTVGDLILNPLTHAKATGNPRAEQGLATQVLIWLMTDRRVEASELRRIRYSSHPSQCHRLR